LQACKHVALHIPTEPGCRQLDILLRATAVQDGGPAVPYIQLSRLQAPLASNQTDYPSSLAENDGVGWRSSNKTLINRPLTEAALAARYDTGKVTIAMVDGQEKLVLLPDVVDTATGVTSLTKVSVTIEQLARFWYKVTHR
jgi:hypothetical protein